ncbi:Kynurenine formamidase [Dirofilaria immitis]
MSCRHGIECTEQECLYSPSHWSTTSESPELVIEKFIATMQSCYHENLRIIPLQQSICYGDGKQMIDIWGDEIKSTKAMILFHGGYWQEGDRKLFTSPVKILVDEGFVVACVGYDFATTIGLNSVVEEATKALDFLAKRWPDKMLSIGGHSAGAHLALSALMNLGEDAHQYQKIILFSGIYDLHPLLDTYIGKAINLSLVEAKRLSLISLEKISTELLVIIGADESPKFKEQNQHMVENYMKKYHTKNITDCYKVIPNNDHFTLITSLADKNSRTTKELLHFILQ